MLKLLKRGNIWYVRGAVAGIDVYESTRTSDKAQAERYLAQRQNQIYNKEAFGEDTGVSFDKAVEVYLEGKTSLGHTAIAAVDRLLSAFGSRPLSRIKQPELDQFIRKTYPDAAPATIIRSVINPMTAILNAAAMRGWCAAPNFARPKVKSYRARYLSYDEAGLLVDASADHLKPLLQFLLNTGCRIGEALTLQWYAVDLDRKLVVFGKTKHDKTKNDETRGVPLNSIAFTTLARMKSRRGHVFLSHHGKPYPIRAGGGQIKTGFTAACRRSGIGHLRVHDLRHTFASWLAMEGHGESTIAELLGHKSRRSSITGRYTHLNREHLRGAVESIVSGQFPDRAGIVQFQKRR